MSTKSTIAHGTNFHFYHEIFDEDNVYLEMEGTHFEAGYNRVMVPIPVHIWEVIRQYAGVDLSYADKTDEELRRQVEQEVDKRIKEYAEADERTRPFVAMGAFGKIDDPREEQIAQGLDDFTKIREQQRQIKQAIQTLKEMNRRE
jgi:hypothetical protein